MADSIDVTIQTAPITVTVDDGTTVVVGAGTVGPAGATGAAGQGVPVGGTTGQVLAKASGTNYDTEWVDQTGGGGGGSGTVTEVSGTAPISVATGTTTPVVSIAAATTSAAGSLSASDKAKLDGVASGATANATDAQLRDRSTHTGTQTLATVSDAGTAAAKNVPAAGNAASGEVVLGSDSRLSDARTPSSTLSHASTHGAAGSDPVTLAQSQVSNLTTDLAAKVPTTRTVNGQALSGDVTITTTTLGAVPTSRTITAGTGLTGGGDLSADRTLAVSLSASDVPNLDAAKITSGTVATARLGSGTASASTFLRGDQTYQPVPVGNNDMGRVSNACYLTGSGAFFGGLGATAGNTMSTPDAAALDITGDLEMVARVNLPDYTTGAANYLVGKWGATTDASYYFYVTSLGNLGLAWYDSGGNLRTASPAINPSLFVDGTAYWTKATLDVDNGSGQYEVKFYYAADSSSEPSSWTQWGATVTGSTGTSSVRAGNGVLSVGALGSISTSAVGTIYRAIVRSGIGGTTVFDADFSTAAADALAFTESSANAATVTVTTTRYSYGVPGAQFSAQGTQALTANTVYYQPFEVTAPLTLDLMALEVTTAAGSNGNLRLGVYAADANLQPTGAPLFDSGDVTVTSGATGILSKQGTPVTLQPGVYLTATNSSVALTARTALGGQTMVGTAMGANLFTVLTSATQTQGAFPTPGTAWTTRASSTAGIRHVAQMRWR